MMTKTKKQHKANGAALILVVVVTVLLAVIGVMFLMVSRVSEMETASVADQRDLDAAVRTVTGRINEVLVQDLFGLTRPTENDAFTYGETTLSADEAAVGTDPLTIHAHELYDYPSHYGGSNVTDAAAVIGSGLDGNNADDIWMPGQMDDYWLASLEPRYAGVDAFGEPIYHWPHITDLWGTIQGQPDSLHFQRFTASDHSEIFKNNPGGAWIDPDNEKLPAQWAPGAGAWDAYQVSAYNVRAKVIKPVDRMKVILQGSPADVTAWDNPANTTLYGARADADGDGVADSRWVPISGLTTNRGKPVYAAVRIIDNCAMLNLNAAHCFYQDSYAEDVSPFKTAWYATAADLVAEETYHENLSGSGRYLTEMNYTPFLRGQDLNGNFFLGSSDGDYWYNLMIAKGFWDGINGIPLPSNQTHQILMNIENSGSRYQFFDITDELELRNRYLLTSNVEARFERADVANFSLDSGSTDYAALRVPRDHSGNSISIWYERIDPANFDLWSGDMNPFISKIPYKYDRRHVSTFYSYDRNLRRGLYPVLEHDFAVLTSLPGWTAQRIETARKVFCPLGAVTTNIENPASSQPYNTYNNVETRRRILHLLFALREYYLLLINPNYETMDLSALSAAEQTQLDEDQHEAALKAAQVVANLIDYSDDDALNTLPMRAPKEGPFYETIYGEQANVDCTFITEQIIQDMIDEVSDGLIQVDEIAFGLDATDVVFGYERQPFISEVYAYRNPGNGGALEGFAIELLNPYPDDMKPYRADTSYVADEDVWRIVVGDGLLIDGIIGDNTTKVFPKYDATNQTPGRYVVRSSTSVTTASTLLNTFELPQLTQINTLANKEIQLLRPAPKWVRDNLGINFIVVDSVPSDKIDELLFLENQSALKRQDTDWKFVYPEYELQQEDGTPSNYTHTLGEENQVTISELDVMESFQIAVADDGYPLSRWHELEVLSLFGNGPDTGDPNDVVSVHIATAADAGETLHFDLEADDSLLDYLCTMNRPDIGTLPGRININTAPVHVIAAAIPPVLADPNAADPDETVTFSALDLAQEIVNRRNEQGPYKKLSDLLKIDRFRQYYKDDVFVGEWADENVGAQSIEHDIEARHWILSNLANKFTVRSDVFTAYILVRLGESGPQRRMIAIFDRSGVWQPGDRPKLVALHPVPDPR